MAARTGIALRSTVFSPDLVRRIATEVDGTFASVWFPVVSPLVDSFDLCSLSLGASKRLNAGTGVIRLPEHDLARLAERVDELNRASGNRFFLGVGTGRLTGRAAVDLLVGLAGQLRSAYPGISSVPVCFAALGPRMVRAAFQAADGVLLNFCSPQYASTIMSREIPRKKDNFHVACYVKLFFAEAESEARLMLAEEFLHYDAIPQYHRMFEAMGITGVIEGFRDRRGVSGRLLAGGISEISMSNPTQDQVLGLLGKFREAGVDTPVVYPYVKGSDGYKFQLVKTLRDWLD
jgi:alkanesulfonate monooxygenase SsuD/methylene tetrahydromethanopterin reductase-like flavin-dependent oxidoreductase (luciferase family)